MSVLFLKVSGTEVICPDAGLLHSKALVRCAVGMTDGFREVYYRLNLCEENSVLGLRNHK